ncbi:MAG: 50S ribosomal protein L1 [Armatimonadia bacterium]
MPKHSRRFADLSKQINRTTYYTMEEAIKLAKETASAKFDETVEMHLKLGANPSKGDQAVRGTIVLPFGTGKVPRVAVFAEGDVAAAAEAAGADRVGGEDLVQAIDEGWADFDILVAHPSMMRVVGRLGKKLGPRMPSKKSGNVTEDVGAAVTELKAGKVEYRMDRGAVVHCPLGKVSFTEEQLVENFKALMKAIIAARPSSLTGRYLRGLAVASSMGPGIKVSVEDAQAKSA